MPVRFPWWQPVPYLQRVHTGASKNTAIIQELRSQHEQLCHNKARMWNFTNSLLHRSGLATPTEDGNCNKQRYKRKRRQAVPRYIRGTQTESVVLSDGSVLRYAMSQRQADTQNTKSNSNYQLEKDLFSKDMNKEGKRSQERLQELTNLRNGAIEKKRWPPTHWIGR